MDDLSKLQRNGHRFLIACMFAAAYYLPVLRLITDDLGIRDIAIKLITSTIVFLAALGCVFLLGRVVGWLQRRAEGREEVLVLPEDAFEVRINLTRTHRLSLVVTGIGASGSA